MDFIAIDVETANSNLASICQIGIAAYNKGSLSSEWKTYVNPEDNFNPVNTAIHSIDWELVQDAPKLNEISSKIYSLLKGKTVISHSYFDRASLKQSFIKYQLSYPNCIWLDTTMVARRTWRKFSKSGYGLQNICDELGYKYNCHDALEDAKVTAFVFLSAIEKSGLNIEDWINRVKQPIDLNNKKAITRKGSPEGFLYGNNIVFTGSLEITRKEAAGLAAKIGCNVQSGVNQKTNILVVGTQDISRLAGHKKSSKHRKAEDLIRKGKDIRIISEKDFKELLR